MLQGLVSAGIILFLCLTQSHQLPDCNKVKSESVVPKRMTSYVVCSWIGQYWSSTDSASSSLDSGHNCTINPNEYCWLFKQAGRLGGGGENEACSRKVVRDVNRNAIGPRFSFQQIEWVTAKTQWTLFAAGLHRIRVMPVTETVSGGLLAVDMDLCALVLLTPSCLVPLWIAKSVYKYREDGCFWVFR